VYANTRGVDVPGPLRILAKGPERATGHLRPAVHASREGAGRVAEVDGLIRKTAVPGPVLGSGATRRN
jgi:hypothetical protein